MYGQSSWWSTASCSWVSTPSATTLDAQVLGERDDGGDDCGVVAFGADGTDERLVDLEDVDREGAQVRE